MAIASRAAHARSLFPIVLLCGTFSACTGRNPLYNPGKLADAGDATTPAPDTGAPPNDTMASVTDMPPVPDLDGTGGMPGSGTGGMPGFGGGPAPPDAGTGGAMMGAGGMMMGTGGMMMGTGGGSADTNPPVEAPPADTGPSSPATCGTGFSTVTGAQYGYGIAIDRDGNLYYSREASGRAFIGRIRAGTSATETNFAPIEAPVGVPVPGARPRLLRTDQARGYLVVADPNVQGGMAYTIGVYRTPPQIVQQSQPIPGAHGLAIAPDGGIMVSSSNGHVYRWDTNPYEPSTLPITTATVFPSPQRPLGLAFGPDGLLYIGSSNGGIKRGRLEQLPGGAFRLTNLENYTLPTFAASSNDLAFDVDGRLYVADHTGTTRASLAIIAPDRTVERVAAINGRLSGLAFGRGGIACGDLYVSDIVGQTQRYPTGHDALDMR